MRFTTLALLLALVCSNVDASPKTWLKTHRRDLINRAVAGAALAWEIKAIHHCDRGDVEHCFEGYGADDRGLEFGIAMTAVYSIVVMPFLADKCYRDANGPKFCAVIGYNGAAGETAVGIWQWKSYSPEQTSNIRAGNLLLPRYSVGRRP